MTRASILTFAIAISCTLTANAQEVETAPQGTDASASSQWYYGPTGSEPAKKPLGRIRAEQRAQQRTTRMESMRWYGFSASRPTAAGIPFTTEYAPSWTRPGGRPFAWYTTQRPTVLVSPYYPGFY